MGNALFSIKPEYSRQILSGKKQYEFRKHSCKLPLEKIVIYSTVPQRLIIGEVSVQQVIKLPTQALWELTCDVAGIAEMDFRNYFSTHDTAVAYQLFNPVTYKKSVSISAIDGLKVPQSFCYLTDLQYSSILKLAGV